MPVPIFSVYAAARRWQLDGPQRASGRVGAKAPPPGPSPAPQPQPQPAPARSFRWVAGGLVGLVAIAVIVVAIKPNQQSQPQSRPPAPTAPVPSPAPAPDTQQQGQELADREQRTYNAARGDLAALRTYVNSCAVCAYIADARREISQLENAEQEQRIYNAARGNKYTLQAYINTCSICAYANAARAEIATLEAAQTAEMPSRAAGARYQKAACGSIIDTKTGLEWYVGPDVNISWTDASQWAHQLSRCEGGWRLPTLNQLKTLFDQAVSAGTGFYMDGKFWPAHIDPIFSAIGNGSWVWADGNIEEFDRTSRKF